MPYDINQGIQSMLKLPGELKDQELDNKMKQLQAQVLKSSADYYKQSGGSPAQQKDIELAIEANKNNMAVARLDFDYKKHRDDMLKIANDEEKQNIALFEHNYEIANNIYDQVTSDGKVPHEDAQKMVSQYLQKVDSGLPDKFKMAKYDPVLGDAISAANGKIDTLGLRTVKGAPGIDVAEVHKEKTGDRMWVTTKEGKVQVFGDQLSAAPNTQLVGQATQVESQKLRAAQVGTQNFMDLADDFVTLLKNSKSANTLVGGGADLINTINANVRTLAQELGIKNDMVTKLTDPAAYSGNFRALGIDNSRIEGMVTGLAFQAAALTAAQTGRDVSNNDVQKFIGRIGGHAQDYQTMASDIFQVATEVDRNYRNMHRVIAKEEPKVDFGLGKIQTTIKGLGARTKETDTAPAIDRNKRMDQIEAMDPAELTPDVLAEYEKLLQSK